MRATSAIRGILTPPPAPPTVLMNATAAPHRDATTTPFRLARFRNRAPGHRRYPLNHRNPSRGAPLALHVSLITPLPSTEPPWPSLAIKP